MESSLDELQHVLGYRFADIELLGRALTHRSWVEEHGGVDNQRLEFLGDAVLGLVVAREAFCGLSEAEGTLSEVRASLVSKPALHRRALELNLAVHLRVGRGAAARGDAREASTLADAYEAVIAAVFLDGGLDAVDAVMEGWLPAAVEVARSRPREDLRAEVRHPKTRLQEFLQRRGRGTPGYVVVERDGPSHDAIWTVEAQGEDGEPFARGTGRSKRDAETHAATVALSRLLEET